MLTRRVVRWAGAPQCPYCGHALPAWPTGALVHPCGLCKRPMILLRRLWGQHGQRHPQSLLDVGLSLWGLATLILFAAFMLGGIESRLFAKLFAVMLFMAGSLWVVDAALGIESGLDRSANVARTGLPARVLATAKLIAGFCALALCLFGLIL